MGRRERGMALLLVSDLMEQIDDMKHCIGYDPKKVKRGKYEAYRNYYTTSGDHAGWDNIVAAGLADKRAFPHGIGDNPQCYSLNEQGIKFLSDLLGCKIIETS